MTDLDKLEKWAEEMEKKSFDDYRYFLDNGDWDYALKCQCWRESYMHILSKIREIKNEPKRNNK